MNRFEKITKDIDSFVEWVCVTTSDCENCAYNNMTCNHECKEGTKKYFEEEVE